MPPSRRTADTGTRSLCAFFWPTLRASRPDPKPASKMPTRGPVWPKRALSAAMVRSHTTCSTWPPPMA